MSIFPETDGGRARRALAALGFRARFLIAMMVVVVSITAAVVFITRHNAEATRQANLEQNFREQTRSLLALSGERVMVYTDKCRGLTRSVRIRAALEESDLEDLYRNALDELREVIDTRATGHFGPHSLPPANFFGFVDAQGRVVPPPSEHFPVGSRGAQGVETLARQLAQTRDGDRLPDGQEIGYLFIPGVDGVSDGVLDAVIVSPIDDTLRGERLGALALGFPVENLSSWPERNAVGIWVGDRVFGPNFPANAAADLPKKLAEARRADAASDHFSVAFGGEPFMAFHQPLKVGGTFPAASGVGLYSLVESQRENARLRSRIIGWGAAALAVGFALSFLLSDRLARPVERLAQGAVANLAGRQRAEAELLVTNAELKRTLAELKATQAHVIQQERLRALGEMASGIAHDFNNALMPILGFSELLLNMPRIFDDRQKALTYLQTINRGARDAGNVVKRLREFYRSREEGENFLPVDLALLAGQIVDLTQPKWKDQAQARGATVVCRAETQPVGPVMGNESDLREMLTNLVFNAVDAMPNGGSLTLRTRSEDGFGVVEVADTGTGMSEEVRRRCLEPFFSTKGDRGTGLGLSMVFGIVQRHNGTVEIDSRLGEGSTFRVRLPLRQVPVVPSSPDGLLPVDAEGRRRLRVLAVDDEPGVREILTHLLEGEGHRVVTAGGAREALERFHEAPFDLVITDMAMPGMNGEQLAGTIKTLAPEAPVILLTGFGTFIDLADASRVDVVASKPITLEELRRCIKTALEPTLVA